MTNFMGCQETQKAKKAQWANKEKSRRAAKKVVVLLQQKCDRGVRLKSGSVKKSRLN
jgi:hypothetical protein